MPDAPIVTRDAVFSPCRTYRYVLRRIWEPDVAPLAVIGLNPSTADETQDDPTVRRCIGYARSWGHGGLVMLNLFAYRSTDPKALYRDRFNAVGPENDYHLAAQTERRRVLCAWGAHGALSARADAVRYALRDTSRELVHLGLTKGGQPKHPLYLRKDLEPTPWR